MLARPRVRFFENRQGQRVAYATDGEGPPLICVAWWVSHVESDWETPGFQRFFGALAQHHTVVRYDRVGSGLSDRERESVDLASEVATLESLVGHLELDDVALFALACAGPTAVSYAVSHPELVSQLVFFGSYVRGSDVGDPQIRGAMESLVRASWGIGSTALADLFAPGLGPEERTSLGRAQRQAASADMSARLLALTFDAEVTAQAREVSAPALVLHRKRDRTIPYAAGRELAATLPTATLRSLEGDAHLPWFGDVDEAAREVLLFTAGRKHAGAAMGSSALEWHREGDLWRLSFGGKQVHLRHALGLADLAILLGNPGEEVHVGKLWAGVDSAEELGGGDRMLDETALASYKKRLREIEEDLEEAETRQLSSRAEALRREREQLAHELRAAVGRGGRARGLGEVSERARKAVAARIRATIKKISAVHPELGAHLKNCLSTGTYCRYQSEADHRWSVSS